MSPNTNQQPQLIESELSAGGITRAANDRSRVARQ